MPRRPKTMEERKFPRTTGIRAEGKCGHEYDKRMPLDSYAGKFRTPENVAKVDAIIKEYQEHLKTSVCPTCHALNSTEMHEQQGAALTRWLGVDPLPELKGTKRTIGFAMEIRHDAMLRLLRSRRQSGMSLLGTSSVVQAFIMDAIEAKWGKFRSEERPASPDIAALMKGAESLERMGFYGLTAFSYAFYRETTCEEVLSDWLLYRHAMLQSTHPLYTETDASYWIRQHKGTARYQVTRVFPSPSYEAFTESMAADVVARTVAWEDRSEAYAAFKAMVSDAGTIEQESLEHSETGTSFKDMLEQMSVMRALAGPDRTKVFPF
jgi:hypothetical protein